jgi:amphi-Trp domain-containing protein
VGRGGGRRVYACSRLTGRSDDETVLRDHAGEGRAGTGTVCGVVYREALPSRHAARGEGTEKAVSDVKVEHKQSLSHQDAARFIAGLAEGLADDGRVTVQLGNSTLQLSVAEPAAVLRRIATGVGSVPWLLASSNVPERGGAVQQPLQQPGVDVGGSVRTRAGAATA